MTTQMFLSTQYGRIPGGQAERGHPADGRGHNLHWYCAPCSDTCYFYFIDHKVSVFKNDFILFYF